VVLIDVKEPRSRWTEYAKSRVAPSVVALHDEKGEVATRYAPAGAQPSFQDRAEVVLAGTVVVDPSGRIRLFVLPDSAHFDPTFSDVLAALDPMMGGRDTTPAPAPPARDRALPPSAGIAAVRAEAAGPVRTGEGGELAVTIELARGFHVMSDRPTRSSYIATQVELVGRPESGVSLKTPVYPEPTSFALAGERISTFAGHVVVRIPFEVDPAAEPGAKVLHGTVHLQPCTEAQCLFPRSYPFTAQVDVLGR
jgi:hypothetical protein